MSRRARIAAWTLGVTGVVACLAASGVALAIRAVPTLLVVYLVGILFAVLGALVASREPRNPIGWLMCATAIATSLTHLPVGYGYLAMVTTHGALPFGPAAIWLGAWAYVPSFGFFLPVIAVRFPDGTVPRRWWWVDWVAAAGTLLFAAAIALQPWDVLTQFLPIPGSAVAHLSSHPARGTGVLTLVQGVGLALIVIGYVGSSAALIDRLRRARGDEVAQLKWFVYAGTLVAFSFVYAAVAWNFLGAPQYVAFTPLEFAALALPLALGIAILRYRLYSIDLIINRTLVYGSLTAILGAVYAAAVTLLNRLFISISGNKSDAAYVVTAFVVVIASSPIKDWLQRQVDHRFPHRSPTAVLEQFRGDVDAVVSVIDVRRVLRRLVDEAVTAFDARSAALYMDSDPAGPVHVRGSLSGDVALEVNLRHDGRSLGRLVMGSRRGDIEYTPVDREALQRSADSVAEALVVAEHLGRGVAAGRTNQPPVPANTGFNGAQDPKVPADTGNPARAE